VPEPEFEDPADDPELDVPDEEPDPEELDEEPEFDELEEEDPEPDASEEPEPKEDSEWFAEVWPQALMNSAIAVTTAISRSFDSFFISQQLSRVWPNPGHWTAVQNWDSCSICTSGQESPS